VFAALRCADVAGFGESLSPCCGFRTCYSTLSDTNDGNYLPWTGMLRCSRIALCQVVLPSSVLTGPWIWSAVLKIVPCEGCDAAGSPYCLPALARRQDNLRGNILCSLTELLLSLLLLILIVRWLHRGILASTRAVCIWSTFPPGPKLVPCTGCNSQPAQGTSLNAADNS